MSNLEEAAYNYGLCSSQRTSAFACRASDEILDAMNRNMREAENNLFLAAWQHFNNVYDGPEE